MVTETVCLGISLVVQWLELRAFTAKGVGSIPGQETKILQATWCAANNNNKKKISLLKQSAE